MVYTKNTVDLSSIGAKAPAKTRTDKKGEDNSFKTMLDKNAQTQNPETKDTETKDELKDINDSFSGENAQLPQKEEDLELQNGVEVQLAMQYFFPEQERAALKWAETMPVDAEVKPVEMEAADIPVAETAAEIAPQNAEKANTSAVDVKAANSMQDALQGNLKPETAKQGTASLTAASEEQLDQKVQGVEIGKGTEEQVVLTEQKEGPKSTESNAPEATEQKQKDAPELQNAMSQKASETEPMVRIKVGEAIDISAPKAVPDLADTVLVKMQEGSNEYELQLQPEELGKIKIKLVIEAGKISVAMTCENQKAADILAANGGRLKAIIEERTGSETNVQVQQEERPAYYEQERQNQDSRHNEQNQEEQKQNKNNPADAADFLQQLRLGLLYME